MRVLLAPEEDRWWAWWWAWLLLLAYCAMPSLGVEFFVTGILSAGSYATAHYTFDPRRHASGNRGGKGGGTQPCLLKLVVLG
jgi:hypothetical protein